MRRPILLILIAVACVLPCSAQTRWCSVAGRGPQDTIVYPPVARAARVTGLVMGYLKFTPEGKVTEFEPIQGPAMLRESLKRQFSTWTLQTNAAGSELCQTLVVAKFEFCDHGVPCEDGPSCSTESVVSFEPSILRIQTRSQIVWICDPASTLTYRNPIYRVWHSTKHTFLKLFGRQR
jgi:hypothetical protein